MVREPNPDDPRVRRTQRLLQDTAIRLALAGGYDRLTIDELLASAGLSRPTLYVHFKDKWTLLDSALEDALEALRAATEAALVAEHGAFTIEPMRAFFVAASEHSDALRVLLRGTGHSRPLQAWTDELERVAMRWLTRQAEQTGRSPRVPLKLVTRQFAWAVVATLTWWLEDEPETTPEQVTDLFRGSTLLGRAWAMNLDDFDLGL